MGFLGMRADGQEKEQAEKKLNSSQRAFYLLKYNPKGSWSNVKKLTMEILYETQVRDGQRTWEIDELQVLTGAFEDNPRVNSEMEPSVA